MSALLPPYEICGMNSLFSNTSLRSSVSSSLLCTTSPAQDSTRVSTSESPSDYISSTVASASLASSSSTTPALPALSSNQATPPQRVSSSKTAGSRQGHPAPTASSPHALRPRTIASTPTSYNGDLLFLMRSRRGFTHHLAI